MKTRIGALLALVMIVVGAISCMHSNTDAPGGEPAVKGQVKVYYFHGRQRCKTCIAIETLTKEVVSKDFAAEVKRGKVAYEEVDLSTPEGEKLGDKYEISWSSLLLVKDGKQVNLTDMAFGYAKNEPDTFRSKLKAEITQLLK